jgi:hypothetical protein
MIKFICSFIILLSALFAFADNREANIQNRIKEEFGNCYNNFNVNMTNCTPSICTYPDVQNSSTWKALTIKGLMNGKCYAIYYSYVGDQIIGSPDHCFYSPDQMALLANLYNNLFSNDSILAVADTRKNIINFNTSICKKNIPAKDNEAKQ